MKDWGLSCGVYGTHTPGPQAVDRAGVGQWDGVAQMSRSVGSINVVSEELFGGGLYRTEPTLAPGKAVNHFFEHFG